MFVTFCIFLYLLFGTTQEFGENRNILHLLHYTTKQIRNFIIKI